MRSLSASLQRTGMIFLSAAMLCAGMATPGVAKSAPSAATASSVEASQGGEASSEAVPAGEATAGATETTGSPTGETTPQPAKPEPAALSRDAATAEPEPGSEAGAPGDQAAATDGGPERNWIMDEETGRRYSIEKIPKVDGTYIWRDENHIRLPGGLLKIEVVKHDDQWFWVKLWEPRKLPNRRPPAPKPTAEELEQLAASYRPEAGTGDRIRLEPFDDGLPQSGQWRQGFDVADMNGDGHLDIVFGPSRKGRPTPNIFLGDGKGHWRRWDEARFPALPYDYGDAAAADFNGDGHQDVAFGIHLRGMLALIGDGKGGFQPWTEGLELENPGKGGDATAFSSRAIEAIDWNRDGRPDLLALGEGPKGVKMVPGEEKGTMINTARSFALFVNNGDGTWSRQAVEEASGDFGDDFAFGDFDRDGRPDLAIASRRRGNREILRTSAAAKDGLLVREELAPLRPNASLTAVTAADLDGDGFEEILLAFITRELEVWRTGIDLFARDSKGGWQRRLVAVDDSRAGVWDMTVGELDGDGAPDLVAVTGDGRTWVLLGDGEGSFTGETSPELPRRVKGCEGSEVRLVDLDGDGRDEVLASFAGEPTGPKGFPGVITFPGCPGQGRIYAWRAVPATEPAAAPGAESAPGNPQAAGSGAVTGR